MMMDVGLGLRERKRLATRRAIQLAVLNLVAEHGLERITVDEISRTAGISPRTFFNYFPSKEAALVGDAPAFPDDEAMKAFVEAGPRESLLTGLGELIATADEMQAQDHEITLLRKEMLRQHPQLAAIRMAALRSFEDQLGQLASRRLAVDDPVLAGNPEELQRQAELIALVAFATMRHAWVCWADAAATTSLSSRVRDSFARLEGLWAPTTGR